MSPVLAKAILLADIIAVVAVRAPHVRRSTRIKVVTRRKGPLDDLLVALVTVGLLIPFVWMATSVLSFADYPSLPLPLGIGVACLALGVWLLRRSHVDLGTNWSNTLEVREGHALVTLGVYKHIRHPMYAALFLDGVGQALVLPNWIAGPFFLLAFSILFVLRLGPEERMMVEAFGTEYEAYQARAKRLVPSVW